MVEYFYKEIQSCRCVWGVSLQRWALVGIVEFMLVEKSSESRPREILLDQKARSVKQNLADYHKAFLFWCGQHRENKLAQVLEYV